MIAFVAGRVAALALDCAVVEVGGVGLTLQCTPATLAGLRVGETARLPTSLVVREDSLTLYGFADEDERVVFELLQTASGVGPRLAQAILAVLAPDAVRRAIGSGDTATLTRVPGVHWTVSPTPPTSTTAPSGASAATRPDTNEITTGPPSRRPGRR